MRELLKLYESPEHYTSNAISFIDIDETTFHTYAKVKVMKDGKQVGELDNQQFNTYNLKDGEYFNFAEFSSSDVFNKTSTPIQPMVKKIKKLIDCIKYHDKPEKVIFLTARSDFDNKDLFLQTFRDAGIDVDISNVYVERSGNLRNINNVADRKKATIIKYLQTGEYTLARMFDDDEHNLQTFMALGKEINSGKYNVLANTMKKFHNAKKILFFPLLVLPNGSVKRYSLLERVNKKGLLLVEGVAEVKKYYPLIDTTKFDYLIKQDPTYKGGDTLGKYGKWILNLYNKALKDKISYTKWQSQIKQGKEYPMPEAKSTDKEEDFNKIFDILIDFDVLNKKIKRNIDTIKSVSELYSVVKQAQESGLSTNAVVQHSIDLIKQAVSKGATIVYKDNEWIILIPKTFESSKVFGSDTNWCTTSSSGYYYNHYKNNYGGQYFINVNLQTGKLYQFHFESNQFMDSSDYRINMDEFGKNNPKLKSFYIEYLNNEHKEESIETKVKKFLEDEERLKAFFGDTIKNIIITKDGLTGNMDIEDIDTKDGYEHYETFENGNGYRSRDNLTLKTISEILSLSYDWDFFSGDYSLRNESVSEKNMNKKLKNSHTTWKDIMNIYNDRWDEVDLPRDFIQDIYEQLTESFYDGMGVDAVICDCYRSGTEADAYNSIVSELKDNLPLDKEDPNEEDLLHISLSADDIKKTVETYIAMQENNSDTVDSDVWYEKYIKEEGEYEDAPWLYCWRDSHFNEINWCITEPYYGWNDFDNDMWNEALNHFCNRITEISQMYFKNKN